MSPNRGFASNMLFNVRKSVFFCFRICGALRKKMLAGLSFIHPNFG